ncbi:Uncharacterised protein [BD1-7 clade bacterium]|uniref:Uncharacterized protein n=1 Tax=BD1-7 clade bacterium TaxID=2029982 RepID=A0A5S9Q254_9GAMM|nr:Uncharacterised protein [BD1-7 clade bacterium]
MRKLTIGVISLLSGMAVANVPEPSFVLFGQVYVGDEVVEQPLQISVRSERTNNELTQARLTPENNYTFTLEIPLEASVGPEGGSSARINEPVSLWVANSPVTFEAVGESIFNGIIDERGRVAQIKLSLKDKHDSDGDGIPDIVERQNGQNENDPNDPVAFGGRDIDGDGVSNAAEFLAGTYDPFGDVDGDGFSNEEEYVLGSDPASIGSMPRVKANQGNYSPLHVAESSLSFLKNESGSDLVWPSAAGVPASIVPMYWNADQYLDYLVSSSQGKVYLYQQSENGRFELKSALNFDQLVFNGHIYAGLTNLDQSDAEELWFYSHTRREYLIYKREPGNGSTDQPYGNNLWISAPTPITDGNSTLADIDSDGVPDIVASGHSLNQDGVVVADTIASAKGQWDGINLTFGTPKLITQQPYFEFSHFAVLDNVKEAGFDAAKDLLIKSQVDGAVSQKYLLNLSFNSLAKSDIDNSIVQHVFSGATTEQDVQTATQLNRINTASFDDVFTVSNLDGDTDKTMDVIQFMGATGEHAGKFRVIKGFKSTIDTDGDGVANYKDVASDNPDRPLPQGNIDFDGDGVPYAIDTDNSGTRDSDSDGVPDNFELLNRLDPMLQADANSDADGDNRTAVQEFYEQTDPNDETSFVRESAVLKRSVIAFEKAASDIDILGGEIVLSSQASPEIKLINQSDFSQIRSFPVDDINGVSLVRVIDGLILAGTMSGSIEVWNPQSGDRIAKFARATSSVTAISVSVDSIYVAHAGGTITRWSRSDYSYDRQWQFPGAFITAINVLGRDLFVNVSHPDREMRIIDLDSGSVSNVVSMAEHCCEQTKSVKNGAGLLLLNANGQDTISTFNIGNLVSSDLVVASGISDFAVHGDAIYIGRKSGLIEKYSLLDGTFLGNVATSNGYVRKIQMLPQGMVTLHSDGTVHFWEYN